MKFSSVFLIFIPCFLFFACAGRPVFGAELFINSADHAKVQELGQGGEFLANIFLDTKGQSINTVGADISFPAGLLELKEIRTGNSIINFWVSQPKETKPGTVNFSGIIPGGYAGTTGPVLSLVFLAKENGKGAVDFGSVANILLNDGKGTQASLKTFPLNFSVSSSKNSSSVPAVIEPVNDSQPPDGFAPEVAQNPGVFNGKYFLVFGSKDSGSGIDHYEVYETKKETGNLTDVKWDIAASPYVLTDQSLQSFIYVKAVDGAGNGRIEKVLPKNKISNYETWRFWIIIIIIVAIIAPVLVFYLLRKFLWKK